MSRSMSGCRCGSRINYGREGDEKQLPEKGREHEQENENEYLQGKENNEKQDQE